MALQPCTEGNGFFTNYRYLSINREFILKYIRNKKRKISQKETIQIEKVTLNIDKLLKCVTYNEHAHILRWDLSDWKSCVVED